MRKAKEVLRRSTVMRLLNRLREGLVIVEGKHDIKALNSFGIRAITFNLAERMEIKEKSIYLFIDDDRRGREKKEQLFSILTAKGRDYNIDTILGTRLLRILNSTSVEQIRAPIINLIDGNNGKDIS